MSRANRFSPEVRERAVRLVRDPTKDHASQWAAIQSIAAKLGCTAESLRRWVREDERNAGERPGIAGVARRVQTDESLESQGQLSAQRHGREFLCDTRA